MEDPEITASEARRDPLAGTARGVMRVVDALTQTALVVATATLAWALWRRSDAYAWFGGLAPGTAVTLAVLVTLVALLGVWMGVRTWRRVG
ncbi:conserved protein of unknown function (plasmid) [Cupriavidus taiwanensis]|uniref:Uncharacterized protein n=1 Tax=Cupriavidus taiwanensis TaxID=164546 RepID=A0A375IQ20_9BURK|nr:hypothetical protein [Cupriavidus taiwanensis]SOY72783.1 conserved hypothetical protein [Cupriavidus taiwanensis]SOY73022.1 conserved hypothetical protein [Cupriavidus taiwanensis]SOY97017.1 conserved hypothetical protein [Cupriavidus taiwanensis]SOZ66885.1 conserved hypothetical protein [Cupriavidus taiwanensis]SOZ84124.1 conserved hypothetical protein [Cupriavidus taiwanensis]